MVRGLRGRSCHFRSEEAGEGEGNVAQRSSDERESGSVREDLGVQGRHHQTGD